MIQNNYEEKGWSTYKIWKNHLSKKWGYSSVKHLLNKSRDTGSMNRRYVSGQPRIVSAKENMDLIEEFTGRVGPYAFNTNKNCQTTRN